ncbi:DUF6850 family outer membrane beta-barrel protein [Niabella aurantiaca]|uniref:DUF6850 family outer membrane beta-barrel protein n=1 Tax=Niabella aurantiaca TaxID=379900 RepID=UPI00035D0960|nr:DUF6850 family outer membrane beta-barrel protein [Niabella aurantiaca]
MAVQKKTIFAVLVLFLTNVSAAQDSVEHNSQTEHFAAGYTFFSAVPVLQPFLHTSSYGKVEGYYNAENGNYIQAQDAPRKSIYGFYSEGTSKIKKYLVNGSFSYAKLKLDSVGYTLKYDPNDPSPYYLYAGKKGNWDIIKYNLKGNLSRSFSGDKLFTGLGIDYYTHDGWRINDPRPEHFKYRMLLNGAVNYRFLPDHYIGIQGGFTRGFSETQVNYQNENYRNNIQAVDFVTHLEEAYGQQSVRDFIPALTTRTDGSQWAGSYNSHTRWGNISLLIAYQKKTSLFSEQASAAQTGVQDYTYGTFFEDNWSGTLFWEYQNPRSAWHAKFDYFNNYGYDFNETYAGNNYVYFRESAHIIAGYGHIKDGAVKYELDARGAVSYLFRATGSTGLRTACQFSTIGLSGAYYSKIQKAGLLKTKLLVNGYIPFSGEMKQPASQSTILSNVVYRDYYFFTSPSYLGSFYVTYSRKYRKLTPFIELLGSYQFANIKGGEIPAMELPGNNRSRIQLSLGCIL